MFLILNMEFEKYFKSLLLVIIFVEKGGLKFK